MIQFAFTSVQKCLVWQKFENRMERTQIYQMSPLFSECFKESVPLSIWNIIFRHSLVLMIMTYCLLTSRHLSIISVYVCAYYLIVSVRTDCVFCVFLTVGLCVSFECVCFIDVFVFSRYQLCQQEAVFISLSFLFDMLLCNFL